MNKKEDYTLEKDPGSLFFLLWVCHGQLEYPRGSPFLMTMHRFMLGKGGQPFVDRFLSDFVTELSRVQALWTQLTTQIAEIARKGNYKVKAIIFL